MSADRREKLAHAAYLYYVQDQSQAEVAQTLGVTRSNVSRMLRAAREQMVIRFIIDYPLARRPALEAALKSRFAAQGVNDVVVAAPSAMGDLDETRSLLAVGQACCKWLDVNLRQGTRLGLCYSSTVETMINSAQFDRSVDVEVVQICGELSIDSRTSGHDLVRNLAERLGGHYRYFNAPATASDAETALTLMRTPQVAEALDNARKCDVALVGIGAFGAGSSELFLKRSHATPEEVGEARSKGATGQISGRFFDASGEQIDLAIDRRVISLDLAEVSAIPTVVGLASGAWKAEAIRAAIRGGLVNVLVIDEALALALEESPAE